MTTNGQNACAGACGQQSGLHATYAGQHVQCPTCHAPYVAIPVGGAAFSTPSGGVGAGSLPLSVPQYDAGASNQYSPGGTAPGYDPMHPQGAYHPPHGQMQNMGPPSAPTQVPYVQQQGLHASSGLLSTAAPWMSPLVPRDGSSGTATCGAVGMQQAAAQQNSATCSEAALDAGQQTHLSVQPPLHSAPAGVAAAYVTLDVGTIDQLLTAARDEHARISEKLADLYATGGASEQAQKMLQTALAAVRFQLQGLRAARTAKTASAPAVQLSGSQEREAGHWASPLLQPAAAEARGVSAEAPASSSLQEGSDRRPTSFLAAEIARVTASRESAANETVANETQTNSEAVDALLAQLRADVANCATGAESGMQYAGAENSAWTPAPPNVRRCNLQSTSPPPPPQLWSGAPRCHPVPNVPQASANGLAGECGVGTSSGMCNGFVPGGALQPHASSPRVLDGYQYPPLPGCTQHPRPLPLPPSSQAQQWGGASMVPSGGLANGGAQAANTRYMSIDRSRAGVKKIASISRSSAAAAKASKYSFLGQLLRLNLKAVCLWGTPMADADSMLGARADADLAFAVDEWVEADKDIVAALQQRFIDAGTHGRMRYDFVCESFLDPLDSPDDAKLEADSFSFAALEGLNGMQCRAKITEFLAILDRMRASQRGTQRDWIVNIYQRLPDALSSQLNATLTEWGCAGGWAAVHDLNFFTRAVGAAADFLFGRRRMQAGERAAAAALAARKPDAGGGPSVAAQQKLERERKEKEARDKAAADAAKSPTPRAPRKPPAGYKGCSCCGSLEHFLSDCKDAPKCPNKDCKSPHCPKAKDPDGICESNDPIPQNLVDKFSPDKMKLLNKRRGNLGVPLLKKSPAVSSLGGEQGAEGSSAEESSRAASAADDSREPPVAEVSESMADERERHVSFLLNQLEQVSASASVSALTSATEGLQEGAQLLAAVASLPSCASAVMTDFSGTEFSGTDFSGDARAKLAEAGGPSISMLSERAWDDEGPPSARTRSLRRGASSEQAAGHAAVAAEGACSGASAAASMAAASSSGAHAQVISVPACREAQWPSQAARDWTADAAHCDCGVACLISCCVAAQVDEHGVTTWGCFASRCSYARGGCAKSTVCRCEVAELHRPLCGTPFVAAEDGVDLVGAMDTLNNLLRHPSSHASPSRSSTPDSKMSLMRHSPSPSYSDPPDSPRSSPYMSPPSEYEYPHNSPPHLSVSGLTCEQQGSQSDLRSFGFSAPVSSKPRAEQRKARGKQVAFTVGVSQQRVAALGLPFEVPAPACAAVGSSAMCVARVVSAVSASAFRHGRQAVLWIDASRDGEIDFVDGFYISASGGVEDESSDDELVIESNEADELVLEENVGCDVVVLDAELVADADDVDWDAMDGMSMAALGEAPEPSVATLQIRVHIPEERQMLAPRGVPQPSTAMLDQVIWSNHRDLMLLDGGSDATCMTDERYFMRLDEPDINSMGTCEIGTGVTFLKQGPAAMLVGDEPWEVLVLLDKAYLVDKDRARHAVLLSAGRARELQRVRIDDSHEPQPQLVIPTREGGCARVDTHLVHFSSYTHVRPACEGAWLGLAQATQSVAAMQRRQCASYALAHARCMHASPEVVARAFEVPASRAKPCHCCLMFKMKGPSPPVKEAKATAVGECVVVDVWSWKKEAVAAVGTGHKQILGGIDACVKVIDLITCVEADGATAASFVRTLHRVYSMEYKVTLLTILFDGGSIFDCEQVMAVMSELKIRRRQSAEYAHYRILIERYWQTGAYDAATALAFARRSKGYFLHGMVHALLTRNIIMVDEGCDKCRYTLATGLPPPLSLLYVFGADAYGFLFPEQRRAMQFDKADPHSNYGVYVGFDVVKHTVLVATPGKVWSHGVAAIDEKSIIRAAPRSHTDDFSAQELAALDAQVAIDVASGDIVGDVIDSAASNQLAAAEPAAAAPAPAAAVPLSLARPRREPQQTVFYAPPPPGVKALALEPTPSGEVHVLVPAQLHPSLDCEEMGGLGWRAQVVAQCSERDAVRVQYVHGKAANGQPFPPQWLRRGDLELISNAGAPLGIGLDGANAQVPVSAAAQIASLGHVDPASLAMMLPGGSWSEEELSSSSNMLTWGAPLEGRRGAMQIAAVSRRGAVKEQLLTLPSGQVWEQVPSTATQARRLPKWQYWSTAMDTFISKTEGLSEGPGFILLAFDDVQLKGHRIYRVLWVFKASVKDGEIAYAARLVFDKSSFSGGFVDVVTFADTARAQAWRTLLHLGASVGATMVRRDVPNAHQTTRIPEGQVEGRYTKCPPEKPMFVNGKPAVMKWINFLNGMPPAAAGFSMRLDGHFFVFRACDCGFTASVIFARVFILTLPSGEFMWLAIIVDDILVVTKSKDDWLLDLFDQHMELRWPGMKRLGLDGFLNFSLTRDLLAHTLSLSTYARKEALIAEFFAEYLETPTSALPQSPFHPALLTLEGVQCDKYSQRQRDIISIAMRLLYIATNENFECLFAVNKLMRGCSPAPHDEEGWLVVSRLSLYMWGARDMSLSLGGIGADGEAAMLRGRLVLDPHDERASTPCMARTGGAADSGHAEDGPSTGGYVVTFGDVVVHAKCATHKSTTLATSDSELYEASVAAAVLEAFRDFAGELGFPQEEPTLLDCDNSAVCAMAGNEGSFKRSLYLARRVRFLQQLGRRGVIKVRKIGTDDNIADLLTKVLAIKRFKVLRHRMLNVHLRPSIAAMSQGSRVRAKRVRPIRRR